MIPIVYRDPLSFKPLPGYSILYLYTLRDGRGFVGMTTLSMDVRHGRHMRGLTGYQIDSQLSGGHTLRILEVVPSEMARDEEARLVRELGTRHPDGWNHVPKAKPQRAAEADVRSRSEEDPAELREGRPIACFGPDGKMERRYGCFEEACLDMRGRTRCTAIIRSATTPGRTAYGYVWRWL